MELWLGVENFAKIQSAKVCINKYSVLVGPNNSGKTFLMQLIQGMDKNWESLLNGEPVEIVLSSKESTVQASDESADRNEIYRLDAHYMELFIDAINKNLFKEKENIVKRIFGREISIGNLFIEFTPDEHCDYLIESVRTPEQLKTKSGTVDDQIESILNRALSEFSNKVTIYLLSRYNHETKEKNFIYARISTDTDSSVSANCFKPLLSWFFWINSLFLPASRTGLLMLYKDFFANKADLSMGFRIGVSPLNGNERENRELTLPVYEFIRFLQTFSEDEKHTKMWKNELLFFEQNVIEGHITASQQGNFLYSPQDEKRDIPLFLASSMVNEVAPIGLALISHGNHRQFIIDEIEASLHPGKQTELVRFLNRIRNRGISLILSTHSDTFVSRLNNLYIISANYPEHFPPDMLQKLGLEKEDLIDVKGLFVYEFVRQANGKSIVKQVRGDSKKGFVFDLFTGTAMKLFNESTIIEEGLNGGKD